MNQGLLPTFPIQDHEVSLLQTQWKKALDPLLKTASPAQQSLPTRSLTLQTNNQLQLSDYVLFCNASSALTLVLPNTAPAGKQYVLEKTDSTFNLVTIVSQGNAQIAFGKSTTLATQGETLTIVYDGTNWQVLSRIIPANLTAYTPTFTGFGTVSAVSAMWWRDSTGLGIKGFWTCGTSTAVTAKISLPSGLTLDGARLIGNQKEKVGTLDRGLNAVSTGYPGSTVGPFALVTSIGTDAAALFISAQTNSTAPLYIANTGTAFSASGDNFAFKASGLPITGWKN